MKMSRNGEVSTLLLLLSLLAAFVNAAPGCAQGIMIGGSSNYSTTYKYEGNLISRKFHQPNCPYSLVMARSRKIKFDTKKQALAEGYRACRFCLAGTTRTVRAKLINIDISR
ncbi:hypothetical protein BH11CYA1_BH11CYA1_19120 [soil metagenome]